MGRSVQAESRNVPINFSVEEINKYLAQFKLLDKENKGYITLPDIRRQLKVKLRKIRSILPGPRVFRILTVFFFTLQSHGDKFTDLHLHEVLNEVDMNRNGQIDVGEYLQVSQSINQSMNQWVDESTNQSISGSINWQIKFLFTVLFTDKQTSRSCFFLRMCSWLLFLPTFSEHLVGNVIHT